MIRLLFITLAILTCTGGPLLAAPFDHVRQTAQCAPDKPCTVCHQKGADSIVPERKVCLACHQDAAVIEAVLFPAPATHGPAWSLNHSAAARAKAIDCEACHEQADCLDCHAAGFADEMGSFSNAMVNVHRGSFSVSHPIAARTDPRLCTGCHEQRFCQDCHDRFAPEDRAIYSHRRGWGDHLSSSLENTHTELGIIDSSVCEDCHPGSVSGGHEWNEKHGREARKNLATCQACHPEGDICLNCHSAVTGLRINPHPANWDSIKGRVEGASKGRTCRKCH